MDGNVTNILRDLSQINLVQIGAILLAAWLLVALSQRLLPWVGERLTGRFRLYTLALVPVFRLFIIATAVLWIVPLVVEPTFENLVALFSAVGLAVGFALKDYVSSLIAGVVALFEMPYRAGDWVEIEGAYGEVRQVGMRAVRIRTPDDTMVVIPHLKLWQTPVYNANDGGPDLMCVVDFYLAPEHDGIQVKEALRDVALSSAYTRLTRPVQVILKNEPWGTHYKLKAYPVEMRQQFDFISDLTIRGKEALRDLGVSLTAVESVAQTGGQA